MTTIPLLPERIARAKASYTTHLVRPESMATLLAGPELRPDPGDLLLARVEAIGQHKGLERPDGRKAALFCGDEVIVVYGHRYAPISTRPRSRSTWARASWWPPPASPLGS